MSKIFYDHLVVLADLEYKMTTLSFKPGEKEKVQHLIEETVHYRVMTKILDHLPKKHHNEFLNLFYEAPHHPKLLEFLKSKVENIEDLIREEINSLEKAFLKDFQSVNRRTKKLSKSSKKK